MNRFWLVVGSLSLVLVAGVFLVVSAMDDRSDEEAGASTTTTPSPAAPAEPTPSSTVTSPATTTTGPTTSTSEAVTTTSPTTSSAPATTIPPTTTMPAPPFSSSITTPTEAQLYASWEPGCPVGPSELRMITMSHWNYAGGVSTGQLVVAASLAADVVAIFHDLYEAGFPIERMELVDEYGGDDDASMAANNTSAFNCRLVTGGSTYSEHSYGRAIDVNPLVNPYVNGSTILPPAGATYADRSLDAPGMIHAGDEVVQAFSARGWIWGGTWTSLKDYQHFSTTGK